MRIDCVMMIEVMTVIMPVVMMVIVRMVVIMIVLKRLEAANASAESIAETAVRHVRAGRIRTLPFDVVMMAFLYGTHFALEPQHGRAVFAQNTRWWWHGPKGGMRTVLGADLAVFAIF